jgi:hypothetical protein
VNTDEKKKGTKTKKKRKEKMAKKEEGRWLDELDAALANDDCWFAVVDHGSFTSEPFLLGVVENELDQWLRTRKLVTVVSPNEKALYRRYKRLRAVHPEIHRSHILRRDNSSSVSLFDQARFVFDGPGHGHYGDTFSLTCVSYKHVTGENVDAKGWNFDPNDHPLVVFDSFPTLASRASFLQYFARYCEPMASRDGTKFVWINTLPTTPVVARPEDVLSGIDKQFAFIRSRLLASTKHTAGRLVWYEHALPKLIVVAAPPVRAEESPVVESPPSPQLFTDADFPPLT